MKKSVIITAALLCTTPLLHAQISKGGLPQSAQNEINYAYIPVSHYANPDWEAHLQQEKARQSFTSVFLAALFAEADFGFPQSGQMVTLDNGQRIWRGQIEISDAPAIGLLYDQFMLPKGVRLFLSNANGKQVLGAFDADNNDPSLTFATDAVQGSVVTVELDIDPDVVISEIKLHVDRAAVYHRGIEHLRTYALSELEPWDAYDNALNGSSSTCMVNAICPQGANYAKNRQATVQILTMVQQGVGLCSGTLVNNTGNTVINCTPYLLTATHCEPTGSVSSSTYNQSIVRFNFEHSACTGSSAPTSQSMTGLNFVARAAYTEDTSTSNIKGDFMLFSFKQTIPSSYNAVLSGWNNSASIATTVSESKKFIGFHHPDGDNKKLSYTHQIQSAALGAANTHWAMILEDSYGSTGSSGSGLFDGNGYLIGQLSVGGDYNVPNSCQNNAAGEATNIGDYVAYSKFAYVWDYSINGSASNRKLKPWLDPGNTGATTIGPAHSDCSMISSTGIHAGNSALDAQIALYPNPVRNGQVTVQYNLNTRQDISITVYDLSGKATYKTVIPQVLNGAQQLDLSTLAQGMYMMHLSTAEGFATKKLMLTQ